MKRLLLVFFASFAVLATRGVALAHEDTGEATRDKARNHLVKEVLPALYTISVTQVGYPSDDPSVAPEAQERHGSGSGYGVTDDGLVMTAAHVVVPRMGGLPPPIEYAPQKWKFSSGFVIATLFELTNKDGKSYPAHVVLINTNRDIAVLAIDDPSPISKKFPYLAFNAAELGYDAVVAVGSPFHLPITVTEGVVSNPSVFLKDDKDGIEREFVETDAVIHPGNSGGPLIRLRDHKVVGTIDMIYSPIGVGIGIGYAIPNKEVIPFVEEATKKFHKKSATQKPKLPAKGP